MAAGLIKDYQGADDAEGGENFDEAEADVEEVKGHGCCAVLLLMWDREFRVDFTQVFGICSFWE